MSIELAPPDPMWPAIAVEEGRRWQVIPCLEFHHIGSTAIPGIAAKPVIDLMPVVQDIEALNEAAVLELGYLWRGEFGIPGRRYCTLTRDGKRLFNVHVFAVGSPQIQRHLDFRDYLRAHPAEAFDYEQVKLAAAALCSDDVLAYNDFKSPWIQACELRAREWAKQHDVYNH